MPEKHPKGITSHISFRIHLKSFRTYKMLRRSRTTRKGAKELILKRAIKIYLIFYVPTNFRIYFIFFLYTQTFAELPCVSHITCCYFLLFLQFIFQYQGSGSSSMNSKKIYLYFFPQFFSISRITFRCS